MKYIPSSIDFVAVGGAGDVHVRYVREVVRSLHRHLAPVPHHIPVPTLAHHAHTSYQQHTPAVVHHGTLSTLSLDTVACLLPVFHREGNVLS